MRAMCQDINLTSVPSVGHITKTIKKPLADDARCLLRAIDAVSV